MRFLPLVEMTQKEKLQKTPVERLVFFLNNKVLLWNTSSTLEIFEPIPAQTVNLSQNKKLQENIL